MSDSQSQHHDFEAEVGQLLHLVTHSLYSNKEIFLRELISNASDALDRLRFEAVTDDTLYEGDSDLAIHLEVDDKERTLTLRDNGIGMSRKEVVDNIGTIARSGTRAFLESLSENKAADLNQIGQFGVGFYSAFIVADRVTLTARRAGGKRGTRWESDGTGGYELSSVADAPRGVSVTLHLKDEESEFLDEYRLRTLVQQYSDHTAFPIRLHSVSEEGAPEKEWETINQASALWTRPKKEISDDDYIGFYKHVAHDPSDPLVWTHHRVEGRHEYSLLLYVPGTVPYDLFEPNPSHGVRLYVRRVFILDDPETLMPRYLRFVRGVIDSDDLPLNVSRELLQDNRSLDVVRSTAVKKVLDMLEKLAEEDGEKYEKFWEMFGPVLKEGAVEDNGNRERILKLSRFRSTRNTDAPSVSLEDYRSRMVEGQDQIYYLTAENEATVTNSPHLEIFRQRGIEVLLLIDRVDEWVMNWVHEYDGISFQSVARGELRLPGEEPKQTDASKDTEESDDAETKTEEHPMCVRIKEVLGDRVEAVRPSTRLTDSPSCLVHSEHGLSPFMEDILRRQGQEVSNTKLTLEINPEHALLQRMQQDEERFEAWAHWLFDQASLAEGVALEDPAAFVSRMNELLAESADQQEPELDFDSVLSDPES